MRDWHWADKSLSYIGMEVTSCREQGEKSAGRGIIYIQVKKKKEEREEEEDQRLLTRWKNGIFLLL